jgi:hypothetical protein
LNKAAPILALALALAVPPTANAFVPPGERTWNFRVLLGDKDIGEHRFSIRNEGARDVVRINADFDVKILFVNAYSYDHENVEHWVGDCMHRIEAETDDNGDLSRVLGARTDAGFTVERTSTAEGSVMPEPLIPTDCVRSFAYWNPEILRSDRLLNAQTGEWVNVEISDLGADEVEVDGQPVAARKYRIGMDQGPITLWYAQDNQLWLALEAVTEGGRTLRYQPVQLPAGALQDKRLAARER